MATQEALYSGLDLSLSWSERELPERERTRHVHRLHPYLGKYIPQGVPDTFGFNGIDAAQTTGDTVALTYPSGVGVRTTVKFRWNGGGVELIGNTPGA